MKSIVGHAAYLPILQLLAATMFGAEPSSPDTMLAVSQDNGVTEYRIAQQDCSVSLSAFPENSINASVARLDRKCKSGLAQELAFIALILYRAESEGVFDRVNTIAWGSIDSDELQARLAAAAVASEHWLSDHSESRQKSSSVVVDLINEGAVFRELESITTALGLAIYAVAAEGILYRDIVTAQDSGKSESTVKVPYTALVWFSVTRDVVDSVGY